jgi:predicted kinase
MTAPKTPMIHLVCGSTGAGKTTYAKALCDKIGAVRFSIDEWMTALFWKDAPQPIEFAWAIERVVRCETVILPAAVQCAGRGAPAVLDLGFTTADQRARIAKAARDAGFETSLHLLDVDREVRWGRVEGRNRDRGETFAMHVDRGMFDFVETLWERPDEAELAGFGDVTVTR